MNQFNLENGVAAIRVSSVRQGTEGDSPEAQKEQLEQFARSHNIKLVKTFVFLESASKLNQPMQEAIDFCKNPKNDVQLFIIKSIDRFTRGGATPYDLLKNQLEKYGVKLVDIYGIISSTKVNTLEHLGVKYVWSEYSPTQKIEFLEAERAKDELRDIMSLIGIGHQDVSFSITCFNLFISITIRLSTHPITHSSITNFCPNHSAHNIS